MVSHQSQSRTTLLARSRSGSRQCRLRPCRCSVCCRAAIRRPCRLLRRCRRLCQRCRRCSRRRGRSPLCHRTGRRLRCQAFRRCRHPGQRCHRFRHRLRLLSRLGLAGTGRSSRIRRHCRHLCPVCYRSRLHRCRCALQDRTDSRRLRLGIRRCRHLGLGLGHPSRTLCCPSRSTRSLRWMRIPLTGIRLRRQLLKPLSMHLRMSGSRGRCPDLVCPEGRSW